MRVLVTGAAGFVGTAVAEVLGAAHWLRCVDIAALSPPSNGECLRVDLADYRMAVTATQAMDAVVHLAMGHIGDEADGPEPQMRGTVLATVNVLEAARRAGIGRFVLMSSGAVVSGYSRGTYIDVGLPYNCRGLYPLTKVMQEIAARQYAEDYGLTVPALRPWSVVDSRTNRNRLGEPLHHNRVYFGWVCRYDLAEACGMALNAPLSGFQPFHIMSTAPGRSSFDVDRTERLLGWRPSVDFTDFDPAAGEG